MNADLLLDPQTVAIVVGALIANAGVLISAFISLKVSQVRFEVKQDRLEKDVNNLGDMVREVKNTKGENYEQKSRCAS